MVFSLNDRFLVTKNFYKRMSKINWQQPFVNIFKYFSVESDKNVTKSGDVTTSVVNL